MPSRKRTGPGTPTPIPANCTPRSRASFSISSVARPRTSSGPRRRSTGSATWALTCSSAFMTATLMELAPRSTPPKWRKGLSSTMVDRRPPREAAFPPSWMSPTWMSRATSASSLERVMPASSPSWARDVDPSSRSRRRTRPWPMLSGLAEMATVGRLPLPCSLDHEVYVTRRTDSRGGRKHASPPFLIALSAFVRIFEK